jgi:DNA end-binding protein Ku
VWTGSLAFGLVSIPVKLYNATSPKDIRFRELQAGTARPIRHRKVAMSEAEEAAAPVGPEPSSSPPPAVTHVEAPAGTPPPKSREPEPAEVAYEEVVKGYEVEPDRYVILEPEEIAALAPERTRSIDVADFADLTEIDPVFFEKSYYVVPASGGEKPYWLLHRAMREAGRVAIATFVMRTREYLAAVRPGEAILLLETLFYADEVRDPAELGMPLRVEPRARELDMATRLIESLVRPWEPGRYRDAYRERVMDLIRSRAEGAVAVRPAAEEPEMPAVQDLMAALQASLDAIKDRREPAPEPRRRGRRTG